MRKPVRKRLVKKKGQRWTPRSFPSVSAPENSEEIQTALSGSPNPQDEVSLSTAPNSTLGCSTSSSVIATPCFHDYTSTLSPRKSLLATSSRTEASSNAVTDVRVEVSANSPLSTPTSTFQPAEVITSEPPSTQPKVETCQKDPVLVPPKPPKLPAHVLNELKARVELFLHSGWIAILRPTAIHVALLSKQNTLSIQRNLVFSTCGNVELQVHCKSIDVKPYLGAVERAFPLTQDNINEFVHRIITVVEKIRVLEICAGYDDEKFKCAWASCSIGYVDNNPYQECRYTETFRSKSCLQFVHWTHWKCTECRRLFGPLRRRTTSVLKEEVKPNTGNKYLTEEQMKNKLKEQHKALESAKKKIKRLEERMQELIKREGVYVDKVLSQDFMNVLNSDVITPSQSIFLQQQIKASQQKNSKGMRWHPTMIRLALSIYIQSPSAYEMLRDTGMVRLPSSRTLFDYSHVKPTKEGIDEVVLDDLTSKITKMKKVHQKYHVLMADEMHICQNLVFQKSSGALVGYTTLDEFDKEMKRLEEFFDGKDVSEDTVATKVLVYMVKGVSNGVKEVVATYAVGNLSAMQLYVWTWEVIGALERSGVGVVAFISDGCSVNRKFIKMHKPVTKLPSGVVFDTINKAARGRTLYFVSDVPHLLKTIRNCLFNSRNDKKKGRRLMSRGGKKITWDFIIKLYQEKKGKNLRKSFKLNAMNVFPDSYARMKVKYAAEVISRTVAQDLEDQGWSEASELIFFIRFVNDWFDCLNGAHTSVGKRKRNSNLNPYTSAEDSRFDFILSFLDYLEQWEKEARNINYSINSSATTDLPVNITGDDGSVEEENDPGDEDDTPGSKRILSRQTLEGIEMTSQAFIAVTRFLLKEGADFINARIFTQDPLEQHFSKTRAGQGGSTNPNLGQVLNRNRAIHTIGQLGMRKRKGNAGEGEAGVEVTTEKLPKRRCNRVQNVIE